MKILTDTHALIWSITDADELSTVAGKAIEDPSNTCFVSIASLWEMGIKSSLGKLELKVELEQLFQIIEETGFEILPISPAHILVNTALEFHHRDPFDRIIISQAKCEGYKLLSKDRKFRDYDISLIWD
jgi:PIN domain nuclease of toxin-antitoxin system